jgi:hypothetical protein
MIPLILTAIGAYLIGDSFKKNQTFAEGGITAKDLSSDNLTFNFTINKWGGFEIGDGEYFKEDFKSLLESKPDFFIKTEKFNDYYETTFIPNPFNRKDTSEWTDEELIEAFKYAETYRTTKLDVLQKLKSEKSFGAYEVRPDEETGEIYIDNMAWYYLGICGSGSLISKTIPEKSPKYKELMKEYSDFTKNTVSVEVGDEFFSDSSKKTFVINNIQDGSVFILKKNSRKYSDSDIIELSEFERLVKIGAFIKQTA